MGRVLVLGATGAMGRYLVPELVRRGWQVDAFSLDDVPSTAGVTYFRQNTMDDGVLRDILSAERYDAIVDFMLYLPHQFAARRDVLLENTDH